jgi:hypothetical protein
VRFAIDKAAQVLSFPAILEADLLSERISTGGVQLFLSFLGNISSFSLEL